MIWTAGGTFAGDVNSNKIVDANELAGDMNLNGIIDGAEMLGDMDGSGTIDECEMHGDANGNGIIDGSEVALSIDELALNVASVKAFPNPVSSQLTIKYNLNDLSISDIAQIEIFDIVGKKKEDIILNKGKTQLNLDVTNYNSGIYFYSLNVNGKTLKTERIMVK